MKLTTVVGSVNNNRDYYMFIPKQVLFWSKFDIKFIAVFVGESIPEELLDFSANIVLWNRNLDLNHIYLGQNLRIYYPALLNLPDDEMVMITDMDMLPCNDTYYKEGLDKFSKEDFVYYRYVDMNQIIMCYNAAHPATWGKVFNIYTIEDIVNNLNQNNNLDKPVYPGSSGWFCDQELMYTKLINYEHLKVLNRPIKRLEVCEYINHLIKGDTNFIYKYDDVHFHRSYSHNEKHILDAMSQLTKNITMAISTMTKNQSTRLKEWIEYHYGLGFNKFIIYLDNCTDNSKIVLEELKIKNIDIDIFLTENYPDTQKIDWVSRQFCMFDLTLNNYKHIDWIAFIDIDEFILPQNSNLNLSNFFKNLNTKCVYINSWDFKGPFNETKPILGQTFLCWTDEERYNRNKWTGKSIIRPQYFNKCMDAHHFRQSNNMVSTEFKSNRHLLQTYHGTEVYIDDNLLRLGHFRNHGPLTNNFINVKHKIKKNICIIGGGWYGCYIAEYLLDNFNNDYLDITIIEKNSDIFNESSYKNQNRLHLGFHYPRCSITQSKCKKYFDKFKNKYDNIVVSIKNNYYAISKKSKINYDNFISLFNKDDYSIVEDDNITNIDGNIINVKEMYINYRKAKEYFKNKFCNRVKFITNYNVESITNDNDTVKINNQLVFDKVFNCTYNQINNNENVIYEKCLTLLYKKINSTSFDCLTIMDGEFSSLYYYNENIYTLTNVKYTPLITSNDFNIVNNYNNYNLNDKVELFEKNIIEYFPDFKKHFEYTSLYESYKCKNISTDDSRDININIEKNVFNVWCGKISFIFEVDDYINNFIYSQKNHE